MTEKHRLLNMHKPAHKKEQDIKLQIIQEFATKVIKNTKDINPKYAKLANKHFWDLI